MASFRWTSQWRFIDCDPLLSVSHSAMRASKKAFIARLSKSAQHVSRSLYPISSQLTNPIHSSHPQSGRLVKARRQLDQEQARLTRLRREVSTNGLVQDGRVIGLGRDITLVRGRHKQKHKSTEINRSEYWRFYQNMYHGQNFSNQSNDLRHEVSMKLKELNLKEALGTGGLRLTEGLVKRWISKFS